MLKSGQQTLFLTAVLVSEYQQMLCGYTPVSTQVGFELQVVQVPVGAPWSVLHNVPSAHVPLLVSLSQHDEPAGRLAPLHMLVLVEPGTGSQVKGDMQHCEE